MDSKDRPVFNVPALGRDPAQRVPALDPSSFRLGGPAGGGSLGGFGAEQETSINLPKVALRAVARHWWQILGLWLAGTALAWYLIMSHVKPQFEAASLLRVEPSNRDLFGTGAAGESFEPYLETQVQLITSPNVIAAALADPKAASVKILKDSADPEAELRRKLLVSLVPRSYLIRVVMISPSAADAATAVNLVVDAYLKTAEEWSDGMTRAQIKSLENYQRQLQDQADERKEVWLALASKSNVEMQLNDSALAQPGANLPVPARNKATVEEYRRVKDELFRVTVQLAEAEAILSVREGEALAIEKRGEGVPSLERAFRADPEIAALATRIEKAELTFNAASRLSRSPSDPSVATASKQLNILTQRYRDLFEARKAQLIDQIGHSEAAPDASLAKAREKVETLHALRAGYEKHLARLDVINKQEGSDAVNIALVREDLSGLKDMLKAVEKRLEQLRFDAKGQARISRISEARATGIPVSDNRTKVMAVTPAAFLVALVGLFLMVELKLGKVCDVEELSRQSAVEVFSIPPLPGPRLEPGQRGAREREARLQEFLQTLDHLRVAICVEEPTPGAGRCLLITSATAGEGKTTLTAQLAACCAKAGVSTLVIDADMRRATLSRILNEESSSGLSDVLQGEADVDDAVISLPDAGFHFLAAGSPGRDPSWLLKSQRIGPVLARYRKRFDLTLIDTPPVLPVPDAITLGRWSDGLILATRFDMSRLPLVTRARRRIASAGLVLAKVVVNGVRNSRFVPGYGNSYGYGYGYGGYGSSGSRGGYATRPMSRSPSDAPDPVSDPEAGEPA